MKQLAKILMLAAVLAACLWAFSNPARAYTEDDFIYEVAYGEATITGANIMLEGNIVLPSSIDGYPVTQLGGYAFGGHNLLTSITIPETVTGIAYTAFEGIYNLEAIWVDGNNPSYASDQRGVLYNKDMTSVFRAPCRLSGDYTLPETVTRIGNEGFMGCNQLNAITIPATVTSICKDAFLDCTMLSAVYFEGTQTQWSHIRIDAGNDALIGAEIDFNENAVTISCELTKPAEGELVPRKSYNMEGTITSQFEISLVEAYIDDVCFASFIPSTKNSVNIRSSKINQNLSFKNLRPGYHVIQILVWDVYSDDPVTVCERTFITEGECEHDYAQQVIKVPACDSPGTMVYTCPYCRDSYTETLYVSHDFLEGKCTQCGYLQYDTQAAVTCSLTAPKEGESVPKYSYDVVGQITSKYPLDRVEAYLDGTCFAIINMNGAKTLTIKSSAINKLKFANLAPGPHTMVIKVADIHYGELVTVCTRNFVTKGTVSCTHNYTMTPSPAATCTQSGEMKYTCTKCTTTYTVTIAGGHRYEKGACSLCGQVKTYHMTLQGDQQLDISLQQDLYVDLNGHTLSGTIRTNGFRVYGMDSTTNRYSCDNMGLFACVEENGNGVIPEMLYTTEESLRYMTIPADGGYSFHRFYVGITHVSLAPAVTGFGYKAEFYGDEMVQSQVASIGYDLWLTENVVVSRTADFQNTMTLRLNRVDVENYGDTPVHACATMTLTDGTRIESGTASYSMRQMVEAINADAYSYESRDLEAITQMIHNNPVMESWNVDDILNPKHSSLYIPGLSVEDVIRYYNEVALDAEYSSGGNAKLVQRWGYPIYYMLEGNYTQADVQTIERFVEFFNSMEGSPGMYPTTNAAQRNLRFCFVSQQGMINELGSNFAYADGGVTYYYYTATNEIYTSTICILQTLSGTQRTSVILEELYNGTGLVQDTVLREDSIVYSYGDNAQWLTEVDQLLLKLLYHPQIQPGMNAPECEAIIRKLYY